MIHILTDFDTVVSPTDFFLIQLTLEQHDKLVEQDYNWSALEGEVVEYRESVDGAPDEVHEILVPTPFNRRLMEENILKVLGLL